VIEIPFILGTFRRWFWDCEVNF